jgi:hypothetical protein
MSGAMCPDGLIREVFSDPDDEDTYVMSNQHRVYGQVWFTVDGRNKFEPYDYSTHRHLIMTVEDKLDDAL